MNIDLCSSRFMFIEAPMNINYVHLKRYDWKYRMKLFCWNYAKSWDPEVLVFLLEIWEWWCTYSRFWHQKVRTPLILRALEISKWPHQSKNTFSEKLKSSYQSGNNIFWDPKMNQIWIHLDAFWNSRNGAVKGVWSQKRLQKMFWSGLPPAHLGPLGIMLWRPHICHLGLFLDPFWALKWYLLHLRLATRVLFRKY